MKSNLKKYAVTQSTGNVDYVEAESFEYTNKKTGMNVSFFRDGREVAVHFGVRAVVETDMPVSDVVVLKSQVEQLRRLVERSISGFSEIAAEAENVPFGSRRSRLMRLHQSATNSRDGLGIRYAKLDSIFGTETEQAEAVKKP